MSKSNIFNLKSIGYMQGESGDTETLLDICEGLLASDNPVNVKDIDKAISLLEETRAK